MDKQKLQTLLGHLEAATMLHALMADKTEYAGYNPAQRAAGLQTYIRKQILDQFSGSPIELICNNCGGQMFRSTAEIQASFCRDCGMRHIWPKDS